MANFKRTLITTIFCLTIGLSGCGPQKEAEKISQQKGTLEYDNSVDISTLKEHKFSDEINRLNCPNEIRKGMSVVDDIDSLKENGIAESIKFNNGKYYSVTNVNGDKYLFLLYDENAGDYNVADGCLVSKLADKALFKKVKVGMNREDIIKKDSSAFIFSDYSYHRLNDKSILKIRYTKNETQYIVSEIFYLDQPISVLDYLTEEDLSKII